MRHKVLTGIIGFFLLVGIVSAAGGGTDTTQNSNTDQANSETASQESSEPQAEAEPAERQPQGKKVTIGTGTFVGGEDVAVGLYDVTAGAGESGNFIVNEGASYNEVIGAGGLGVDKVRAKISEGDQIKISGLSNVTFTPVTAKFVTQQKAVDLYAGTFVVGEDVGEGRYKVTPGSGQSGNFIVNDGASYNEVLGSDFGVPEVTANLSNGDKITISGLSKVTFTPNN